MRERGPTWAREAVPPAWASARASIRAAVRPHARPFARRLCVGLLLGLLATLPGVPGGAGARAVRAQVRAPVYTLVDRWVDIEPAPRYTKLEWPDGHLPGGIDVDRGRGTILAVDRSAETIRVYAADEQLAAVIGGPGAGPGAFRDPFDVAALPDGRMIVSDTGNGRLQILEPDGSPSRNWPVEDPRGLAVVERAGATVIYVVSGSGRRILAFDPEGAAELGVDLPFSQAPEDLAFRGDVRVSGVRPPWAARFLVTDPAAGRLYLASQRTTTPSATHVLAGVNAVGLLRDGWLQVPDAGSWPTTIAGAPSTGLVPMFNTFTELRMPFEAVTGIDFRGVDQAVFAAVLPHGLISLGPAESLWRTLNESAQGMRVGIQRIAVGDRARQVARLPGVELLDDTGRSEGRLSFPIPGCQADSGRVSVSSPRCRAIDLAVAGSNTYALNQDGIVFRDMLGKPGPFATTWTQLAGGARTPIAIDAWAEDLAVLDLMAQEVLWLGPDFAERGRWSFSAGGFKGIMDLALGNGRVYLADQQSGALEVWTVEGDFVGRVPIASGPSRVAAGPDGSAFVLNGAGWVVVVGPDAQPRGAWPAGAPKDRPTDIDVAPDGRVHLADARGEVRIYAADPGAVAPLPPPVSETACATLRDKAAVPREIWIGESVEVQLRVDGECPSERKSAEVILAIDRSGSMAGEKQAAAQAAATTFVALTDPLLTRVGLVTFSDNASPTVALTNDRRLLIYTIQEAAAEGSTNLVDAMLASIEALSGPELRPDATRVVVFMTDGRHTIDDNRDQIPAAIAKLRSSGIRTFTIGLGSDADLDLLRSIATDPASAFHSPSAGELRGIYMQVARRIEAAHLFERATLVDRVPTNMRYLPGTGEPIEPELSPDGRLLTWRLPAVFEPGFLLSYRLEPQEVGYWPTNVSAELDYVDGLGHPGRLVFPIPYVRVLGPTPTPSATPTPSVTPSPSPSPIPSATPSPAPKRLYLPLLIREHCDEAGLHFLLVLDVSSSMADPFAPGGEPKIEALRQAVRGFLESARLERDRVTLIAFHAEAALLASGSDRAALLRAASALGTAPGTRIDRGLALARSVIDQTARPATRPIVVLLSDGSPSPGSAAATRAEAAALRDAGTALYTIAVGADADRELLAELAGSADRAYRAEDPDALRRLYAEVVAGLQPCLPSWAGGG